MMHGLGGKISALAKATFPPLAKSFPKAGSLQAAKSKIVDFQF
jgi:hypothetical protein